MDDLMFLHSLQYIPLVSEVTGIKIFFLLIHSLSIPFVGYDGVCG